MSSEGVDTARVLAPTAGAPLALRASGAWLVLEGAIDVFSTDFAQGSPRGSRTPVMRIEAGELLLCPGPACWPEHLALLGVGTVGARVAPLELREAAMGRPLILRWAETFRAALGPDDRLDAAMQSLQLALDVPSADAPADPARWTHELEVFHTRALEEVSLARLDAQEAHTARLVQRAQGDQAHFQRALQRLTETLAAEHLETETGSSDSHDPLEWVCRRVCAAQGIALPAQGASEDASLSSRAAAMADPVLALARRWKLRARQVTLKDGWHQLDGGPIVGFIEGGGPVALVPLSRGGYSAHVPGGAPPQPVDAAVTRTLGARGYVFYRPLPARPLVGRDLLRFVLQGNVADLVTVLLTLLAGALLGTAVPVVTGIIVGTVIPDADRSLLIELAIGLFLTSVSMAMFSLVQSVAISRVEQRSEAPLQAAIWDRLLNLPAGFFRQYSAGELVNRAMGVSTLRRAVTGAVVTSTLGLIMSISNLCLLFVYDVRLALIALGLLAVQMAVLLLSLRTQMRRQRQISDVGGRLGGLLAQLLSGIAKIRVAGVEERAFGVWARQFARKNGLIFDARRIGTALAAFDGFFGIATSIVVYATVALSPQRLTTGEFLAFTSAFGSFLAAFLSMNGAMASVIAALPAYERSRPILDALPEVDRAHARAIDLKGDVELSHVTFRYPTSAAGAADEPVEGPLILDDVSLRARPGEMVAIVGPSGAGKSTLFRLLLGFESPRSGSVFLDGESLHLLDVQAVRAQIGVVLQNGRLMSGDIFRNIVGARALTLDDAWRAAEIAGIADEIRAMPMGMSTVISEGAGNLSGGQRQRLLIARAVAARPRLLLFDEATSALDSYTQARVSEALRSLDATRIVIAHRLSTVRDADQIFVLGNGRVVESGGFDALMAARGPFHDLVRRQLA